MVHEQGEMIDSIEANVESATMRVEEGTNQLRTASNYQVIHFGVKVQNISFLPAWNVILLINASTS